MPTVNEMFARDAPVQPSFADIEPVLLSQHGVSEDTLASFLGRVSPEMREVLSPVESTRLDRTDENVFRPLRLDSSASYTDNKHSFRHLEMAPSFDIDGIFRFFSHILRFFGSENR